MKTVAVFVVCLGVGILVTTYLVRTVGRQEGTIESKSSETHLSTVRVDLSDLLQDWQENPAAVLDRYRGRQIEFSGYVRRQDANFHHQSYVMVSTTVLGDDLNTPSVQAFLLETSLLSQMKDYPPCSRITLRLVLEDETGKQIRGAITKICP